MVGAVSCHRNCRAFFFFFFLCIQSSLTKETFMNPSPFAPGTVVGTKNICTVLSLNDQSAWGMGRNMRKSVSVIGSPVQLGGGRKASAMS